MTITAQTRVAAVIGDPVDHSASPALHNAAFVASGIDAVYVAFRVTTAGLAAAVAGFRAQDLLGVSVTVPHKQSIMSLCDRISGDAKTIGAVNCLELVSGKIIGHNTDSGGFTDALERGADFTIPGARAVLLGAGGAARAVAAGLEARRASVTVLARNPAKIPWCRAVAWEKSSSALAGAQLLVDCTSAGLSASTDTIADSLDLEVLPADALVCSLVYHREPALLAQARDRGLRTFDGAGMLVHQAARAFEIWTKQQAPCETMWRALRPQAAGVVK